MTILAAIAAGLACWLLTGPVSLSRLRRPDSQVAAPMRRGGVVGWWVLPVLLVSAATFAGLSVGGGKGAAIGFALSLPVVTAALVWRRHRLREAATAGAEEVFAACQLLAGLLRVGHVPTSALSLAARDAPVLAEVAAVLQVGGEVAPVLRRLAGRQGRAGLAELGVAWEVAERTGASLTSTLDALAERMRSARKVRDVVAAELSAPRATGRLLAALPVAGLLLGYGFGGDPVGFLIGSPPGQLSLVLGVALGCAGVFWTEHIADSRDG